MRHITDHRCAAEPDQLTIYATDPPGADGANHRYEVVSFYAGNNPSHETGDDANPESLVILFQNGPLKEVGRNGVTDGAVLAVLIDRMRGFQAGPYACEENHAVLLHLEAAMYMLHKRTGERAQRGVEGTSAK